MRKRRNSPAYIKESDYLKLMKLIKAESYSEHLDALEEEIDRANIVPDKEVGKGTVCINSTVSFVDNDTNEEVQVQLVMPPNASVKDSKISVLSPIGSALIGLKKNGYIEWDLPNGKIKKLTVTSVTNE